MSTWSRSATVIALLAAAPSARATPSTTFWAPSTPFVQPFGVLHLTYDTYFATSAAYPIDTGLTMGVLPWKGLQMEVGFDLFYPSFSGTDAIDLPLVLNAKLGAPEDVYFAGQPAWSFGIFGVGFEKGVNDQNVLHAMLGKTLPVVGMLSAGGYYGGETLAGIMAGWTSPAIDVPSIESIVFAADLQTGQNSLGAAGAGAYFYFTPKVALLTGPVFFLEPELQPGRSSWMWSFQLDADVDL